jgi:hypothetical protein
MDNLPDEPEVHQAIAPWDGKCAWCGEDELEGGSDGGTCRYCGDITIPPTVPEHERGIK